MKSLKIFSWLIIVVVLGITQSYAKEINRADYKMTVSDLCTQCTTAPEHAELDLDHFTHVDLGGDCGIIVRVVDNKDELETWFANFIKSYKGTLKNVKEQESTMLNKLNGKGVVLCGSLQDGVKACFDVGTIAGKQKGFIIIAYYHQSGKAEAIKKIQEVVNSFTIKD
jgi:hypothetical protein